MGAPDPLWDLTVAPDFLQACIEFEPCLSTSQGAGMILKTKTGRLFFGKPSSSPASKWKKEWVRILSLLRLDAEANGWHKAEACEVKIWLKFPHPASASRRLKEMTVQRTTKPDLDNAMKLVLDGIVEAGLIEDDRLIVTLWCAKQNTCAPGIDIEIKKVRQP